MLGSYIKTAFRNLKRQKTYSFINVSGLTAGITCFILIFLYIDYEFSFDKHQENYEQIYRVNLIQNLSDRTLKTSYTQVPLFKVLKDEIPEIINSARFTSIKKPMISYKNNRFYEDRTAFTDVSTFEIFSIPIKYGDKKTALKDKYTVCLSEGLAKKYFGSINPINKTIKLNNKIDLLVTGIIQNPPENSEFKYDILISFQTMEDIEGSRYMTNWISHNVETYFLLADNVSLQEVETKINNVFRKHYKGTAKSTLQLEPLKNIHLYSEFSSYGDIKYIYIFSIIGVFIIIIASINFVNLSTARSLQKMREVGIRKVIGSNRFQLIIQFLTEFLVLLLISLIISILLVSVFLPAFRTLTGYELKFPHMLSVKFLILSSAIVILTGLLSGIYPALFLSRNTPVTALKNLNNCSSKRSGHRKILVISQSTISVILIICTVIVSKQLHFIRSKDLGFQKEQILVIVSRGLDFKRNIETFKHELKIHPDILCAAGSMDLPSNIVGYNYITRDGDQNDDKLLLMQSKVDYDFLDTYKIRIIDGRNFSRDFPSDLLNYSDHNAGAVLINEEAVRKIGWKEPVGKRIIQVYGDEKYDLNVVGVIKDFHFESLKNDIKPLSLFLRPKNSQFISVRINTKNIQNTIQYIRQQWDQYNPEFEFEYFFLDDDFDGMYSSEVKAGKILKYFTFLAVFISCLGLFGLASHMAEKRTKEIGIRKVMGASMTNINILLSKDFLKPVLISNIIAWPAAYFFITRWLQNYAYRTTINLSTFFLASTVAAIISILTVSFQTIKVSLINPADTIKHE